MGMSGHIHGVFRLTYKTMDKPNGPRDFIKTFLKAEAIPTFEFQDRPSQLYRLAALVPRLDMPMALRKSDHNLLIIVAKGGATLQINTEIQQITGPCIAFISAGTIYALQSIDEHATGYFVLVESRVLTAIMSNETILNLSLVHPITALNTAESAWFCQICRLFYEEATRKDPNRKIGQSLLRAILYKLLDTAGLRRVLPRTQQIAVQFKHLVNEHLPHQKSIAFFAAELGISANYLNRCLQAVFHKSATAILTETQILRSQLMLLDTTKDIAQIAYELDFDDPSYFSRMFKKITGRSPTAYRNDTMHN